MQAGQVRSNSLTAHLARAGGADAGGAYAGDAEIAEVAEPEAAVDGRCAVSVMPGQRCGRPAPEGRTICANHAAMSGKE